MKYYFVIFLLLFSNNSFGWGERAHNSVGYNAAVLFSESLNKEEKNMIGDAYRVRVFQMGHLANIPDFSWKDPRKKFDKELNSTTHHFNPERILGNLPLIELTKKIKTMDTDLNKIKETYKNFSKEYERNKKFDLVMDVGSAPWRIQEIYDKIVEAFKCSKNKTPNKSQPKNFVDPFQGLYKCSETTSWNEDLYAAFVYSGLLGHFIGDLSQPLHNTSDFDGWFEGQGGIHNFFETQLVENLDQNFSVDVLKKARSHSFQNKVWKKIKTDFSKPRAATQVAYNLVAESIMLYPKILDLDRKFALLSKGDQIPYSKERGAAYAKRKPPSDPTVLKQNRPLIIERVATAAIILNKLWYQAWEDAGKPDISDFGYLSAPYPLDVPFLKPEYMR